MSQLEAHCLTLVLEALACTLVIAITRWAPTLRRWLLVCACASLLTHPFAWWANHALPWPPWPRVAVIEGVVVAAEALIYWRLAPTSALRGLMMSVMANGASFGLGLVILLWLW